MSISEEERQKILTQNFPDTVLGYKRPGNVPADFPYSEEFPQFIAKDEVIYTLTNLITRQLLSNDKYLKMLLESGDKALQEVIDKLKKRLDNNDLAEVTPSLKGLMSAADKRKLDSIADQANNYTHPNSGITAGSYKQVTVNAQGHVTGGRNPNTLAGYGIIDAAPKNHGNHVPALESASNSRFLRNDNTWQAVTPGNIGAPAKTGEGASGTWGININGTATKATQDSTGQQINTTYVKSVTGSNSTLTITKGNGTTSTVTINSAINYGKTSPTMTQLVNWEAMTSAAGITPATVNVTMYVDGVSKTISVPAIKNKRNTGSGIVAYGGDNNSSNLQYGDIILRQSYKNFDKILVIGSNDDANYSSFQLWDVWELTYMFEHYRRFPLWEGLEKDHWLIYGSRYQGSTNMRLSTATRWNCESQNSCIVEIYGLKFGSDSGGAVSREQTFYTNDTFTVPDGVTKIYVTASAGGGGGGGSAQLEPPGHDMSIYYAYNGKSGGAGGTTSLGNLLSLSGGGAGTGSTSNIHSSSSREDFIFTNGSNGASYASSAVIDGYGGGGAGGKKSGTGGAGGRGANCSSKEIAVTPGQKLAVTIGAGGSGGYYGNYVASGYDGEGSAGQPGIMYIKW